MGASRAGEGPGFSPGDESVEALAAWLCAWRRIGAMVLRISGAGAGRYDEFVRGP